MTNESTDGLSLINSSIKNMRWWIHNKLPQNISPKSKDQLYTIIESLENGSANIQRLKNHNLFLQIDLDYEALKKLDIEANAIDFRIIYKTPINGIINSILANNYHHTI